MLPNSGFSRPSSSFERPVAAPGIDPGADRLVCVSFNEKWLPYVIGSLKQLLLNTTFLVPPNSPEFEVVQGQAADLLQRFVNAVGCDQQRIGTAGADTELMIRQNPDNPCLLETSIDGLTWCAFADLSKCLAANPAQPGPGGTGPGPGQSQKHCLKLNGNGQVILPIPVSEGQTITVVDAVGGWNDGTTSWYCPDGSGYVAGACVGFCGHSGGDPSADACHMSIVANINGTFFPTNTPILVQPGISNQDVVFQANDDNLTDNAGSVDFCVIVSTPTVGRFTHHWDFRISDYGWILFNNGVTDLAWVSGVGFVSHATGAVGSGVTAVGFNGPTVLHNGILRFAGQGIASPDTTPALFTWPVGHVFDTPIESHATHSAVAIDFAAPFSTPFQSFSADNNGFTSGDTTTITDFWVTADGSDPF